MTLLANRAPPTPTNVVDLAQPICADPRVSAVAIFGSVARGDANARSDIDILVIHDGPIPDDLADQVPSDVTMAFYTRERLVTVPVRSPLFALHLSLESIVLSDPRGAIAQTTRQVRGLSRAAASELMASTNAKLEELLHQPRQIEMAPMAAAAELYALAKQAAMTLGAAEGRPCFNRHAALHGAYSSLALAATDRAQIDSLEDYWQAVRHDAPDPPAHIDLEWASAAVRRLLTSAAA